MSEPRRDDALVLDLDGALRKLFGDAAVIKGVRVTSKTTMTIEIDQAQGRRPAQEKGEITITIPYRVSQAGGQWLDS